MMSIYHKLKTGVFQVSDLSPLLYNIFTHDIPKTKNTILANFAYDTVILSSDNILQVTTQQVQYYPKLIS